VIIYALHLLCAFLRDTGESVSGYHAKLHAGTKLAVTSRRCGRSTESKSSEDN
jgi:hypothetical protein